MTTPRVTALIDTYNHEAFIAEAIESVLAQDFPAEQMEILVVDDGSTDGTANRIRPYASSGRVRYLHKANGGQASAFNLGFRHARGEIIALLDGDDVWQPQKIRRVMEEFERHPEAGLVYHPYENWDTQRNISVNEQGFHAICGFVPDDADKLLRYGNFGTCGMAVRRDVLSQLLPVPEDLVIYADTYLVYLLIFVTPVVGIGEHLTRYRHYGGNLAAYGGGDLARLHRRWKCYRTAVEHIRAWLKRKGHDSLQPALVDFLERHRLAEKQLGFLYRPPTRLSFYRFLRAHRRLYGRYWPAGYRVFRAAAALAGLVLGYRAYESLRGSYRETRTARKARESLLPAQARVDGPARASTS